MGRIFYTNQYVHPHELNKDVWIWKYSYDVALSDGDVLYEVRLNVSDLSKFEYDIEDESYYIPGKYLIYENAEEMLTNVKEETGVRLYRITDEELVVAKDLKEAITHYVQQVGLDVLADNISENTLVMKEEDIKNYKVTNEYAKGNITGHVLAMIETGLVTVPLYIWEG